MSVNESIAMIKAVVDDGIAEINGRSYRFTKMLHKQRRKVFAFYTKHAGSVERGDFSFLDSPEFVAVESVINDHIAYDESLLSRIPAHWDSYPEDYVLLIATALAVISYPFLVGAHTS